MMSWPVFAHYMLGLFIAFLIFAIWLAICMHRTGAAMAKVNDLMMEIAADTSIDRKRISWLFDELYQVEYREYNIKLLFFKNPTALFGPALQTLMREGVASPSLRNERWWDIYEKIYRDLMEPNPRPESRRWTRLVMARDNVGMEEAMIRLHIRVDDWLYPDRENIKKAMADACAEYDEAMAAQEIMDA